jgi:hypothetical protein
LYVYPAWHSSSRTNKWFVVADILVPYTSEVPSHPDDAVKAEDDEDYVEEIDKVLS